jgi:peptide/nickel transport system ATP-binding protein
MRAIDTHDAQGRTMDPTRDVLLDVRDLRVHYGLRGSFAQRLLGRDRGTVKAVDGVSLELERGEVLGLVGESGSGKTTLGRAILSLAKVSDGAIYFDGQKVSGMSERKFRPLRRRMQLVFQDPHASLNPSMTLLEAVGHPLKIHKVARSREQVRAMVSGALERVGLVPVDRFLNKYPADLSGGQKQRAVLARAIILGPELVVADEPVSMLDMSVRAKVLQLMVDLKRDLGLTYLYITHDLATARFLCDRIAIMYLGRIVEIGPADEVYARPRHPYTKSLLAAIPEPDPRHRIPRDLPRGEVPDAATPPLGCSFHPRCLQAFGPCGWEARDVRALLEERWAALGPTEFRSERPTFGDLAALSGPGDEVLIPAGRGHSGGDVAEILEAHRADHPDEPMWRGVESMLPESSGVRIRFRGRVDPALQRVDPTGTGDSVAVACHLYGAVPDAGPS